MGERGVEEDETTKFYRESREGKWGRKRGRGEDEHGLMMLEWRSQDSVWERKKVKMAD